MSDWLDKAKDFIKGHPDQAREGLDKVEDLINERTGGKYAEQVDQGADTVAEKLGIPADDAAAVPAPAPVPTPEPAPSPELPTDPGEASGLPREPAPSEIPEGTEPAGEQDLPGVDSPNQPPQGGDITLGDPPKA